MIYMPTILALISPNKRMKVCQKAFKNDLSSRNIGAKYSTRI